MSGLPKAARIEAKLAKHVPSAADVQIEKVKAELLALLHQQAPKRLKRRQRWPWVLGTVILGIVIIAASAIVQGARGLR